MCVDSSNSLPGDAHYNDPITQTLQVVLTTIEQRTALGVLVQTSELFIDPSLSQTSVLCSLRNCQVSQVSNCAEAEAHTVPSEKNRSEPRLT